jgi:hypothetical protein
MRRRCVRQGSPGLRWDRGGARRVRQPPPASSPTTNPIKRPRLPDHRCAAGTLLDPNWRRDESGTSSNSMIASTRSARDQLDIDWLITVDHQPADGAASGPRLADDVGVSPVSAQANGARRARGTSWWWSHDSDPPGKSSKDRETSPRTVHVCGQRADKRSVATSRSSEKWPLTCSFTVGTTGFEPALRHEVARCK